MILQQEELKQTPHIVAFLDFLGASKKMTTPTESEEFLQKINVIYQASLDALSKFKGLHISNPEIKIFSDNILIAEKIKNADYPLTEFFEVQGFCRLFQAYALSQGELVRGAITKGELFINKTFVYGKALCNAYYMESQLAEYPRIIVDPAIFPMGNIPATLLNPEVPNKSVVARDHDGMYFLNMFEFIYNHFNKMDIEKMIKITQDTVVKGYSEALNSNKSILNKYKWLIQEFNSFCDNYNFRDYKIFTPEFSDLV